MKNNLRVGYYVRYIPTMGEYTQKISKITNIKNCMLDMCYTLDDKEEVFSSHFDDIIKASDKLIDLIEVGDVLCLLDKEYGKKYKAEIVLDCNDIKSIVNYDQCNLLNLEYELITEEHIKVLQILTKECFEQMSYKVGD